MQFSKNKMVGLNGLEPSTSRLSGVRSNQLSYRPNNGAGDENRTHDISLEGWGFTIKLHPQMAVPTGIEPAISCVTGRHVNRYTTGPTYILRYFLL